MSDRLVLIDNEHARLGEALAHIEPPIISEVTSAGLTYFQRKLRVPLKNGLSLSVIWGSMTYSDNRDHPYGTETFIEEPAEVEVAIIDRAGGVARDRGRNQFVFGHMTMPALCRLLNACSVEGLDPAFLSCEVLDDLVYAFRKD